MDETRRAETATRASLRAMRYTTRPRLVWGDGAASRSVVVDRALVVGATSTAGVFLHDPTVSRVHAELEPRDDGLWVRDLDSKNGVWIEEVRVSGGLVPNGGRLRIGSTTLRVTYDPAESVAVDGWPTGAFGPLFGDSPRMRELFALLARVARSDAPALVRGETGTGKELVARAIHDASPRKDGPFVVVDCAALAESVLDAELFGHAKGAFTGAAGARAGAFEAAHGGTVFLDEIGEVPLALQPKLLRVIESRTVRRLGEVAHRSLDVRFVSATHRDLLAMVAQGAFREDLYFRLSVLPVAVPALRERPRDVGSLAAKFASRTGEALTLSHAALARMEAHAWPGNVRELRNFVDRALALGLPAALSALDAATAAPKVEPHAEGVALAPDPVNDEAPQTERDRPRGGDAHPSFDLHYREFRDAWGEDGERRYVVHLLERHARDTTAMAVAAGIDRSYVYRLMRKYGL
jgi:DNA-binding NtrC family response regulator